MAKGKKKKTGQKQDEPGGSQPTPQEESADLEEAAGVSDLSESRPMSKKEKRAAKKAVAKQQQAGGGETASEVPIVAATPTPVSPISQKPAEPQQLQPQQYESQSQPQQQALPPQQSPQSPQQPVFPALGQQFGRGAGRGRSQPTLGRGAGRASVPQQTAPAPGARGPSPPQQTPWQKMQSEPVAVVQPSAFPTLGQQGPRGPSPPQQLTYKGPSVLPQEPVVTGSMRGALPVQEAPQRTAGAIPKTQPPVQQQQAAQAVEKGIRDITERVGNVSLYNIPQRREINIGGKQGRRTKVDTNHLAVNLGRIKNRFCIHYDVQIDPDKPKRLLRLAVEAFRQKNFPNRNPAFDGRKNLVASTYLFPEEQTLTDEVSVLDDERNQPKSFKISLRCVDKVDLRCLDSYMERGANLELPQKAIQMLDIVIRSAPMNRFVQVGRSFFTQPEEIVELGNGMHMWLGFYQSVTLGWKTFLNIDVAHKGFPAPKNVVEIMKDVLDSQYSPYDPNRDLSRYQKEDITSFLRGLKVEYKLPNQPATKRTYRVNSVTECASRLEFKLDNGRKMTVQQYFQKEKNYNLRFPNMPCLHVGSEKRANPIYLPVELCTVLPGQVTFRKMNEQQTAQMIKSAATSTDVRRRKIQNAIREASFNTNECIQEFGLSISDRFEEVDARILDAPKIAYKQNCLTPARGVWRAESFSHGRELHTWFMINNGSHIREEQMRNFAAEMSKIGRRLGMPINLPARTYTVDRRDPPRTLEDIFLECKKNKAELVVVVIPDKGDAYARVKQTAELQIGLLTQCLKPRTVMRCDPATVSNVLLKVNSKLNGVNHKLSVDIRPPCLKRPVMIIGADVTHPSPDQKTIPSVAAVCASHDPDAFQYNLQYRLQPPRMEIIQDLQEIMRQQLLFFHTKTRYKPERLIFYRDGVSEGQFGQVLNAEVRAIQKACQSLNPNYKPDITFLVVQKRHHTRFFPKRKEDEDGKNKNVPPGTIVDTTITHPSHIDFYLVSHASIQGVSRPTKYRTLWDDANMSVDEVEQLTYYLCHLFSRCTRSVSYPAPTYYAHLAAYRARVYIDGRANINLDNLKHEQSMRAIKEDILKGFPMFFV